MKLQKIFAVMLAVCTLCALLIPSVSAAEDDGLVVHYTFDDPSNPGKDATGNHDATVNGTFTATEGKVDGAVLFDGTENALVVTDTGITSTSFTVSMWVKLTAEEHDSIELTAGHGWPGDKGIVHMAIEKDGVVSLDMSNMWQQFLTGNKTTETFNASEEWTLITYALDGEEGEFHIYFNGVSMFDGLFNGTLDGGFEAGVDFTNFTVGAWTNNDGNLERFLTGAMDDFRLYNRCLSEEEVIALAGDAYVAPPETDPETSEAPAPETDPDDNKGSATDKNDDGTTKAPETDAKKEEGGCGSVMGASALAVALVSVLGCAVVKKQK